MTLSRLVRAAVAVSALAPGFVAAQTVYPKGTTIHDPQKAWQGVTLFGAQTGEAVLIDMAGQVVHKWTSPIPGMNLAIIEPLPNGHILAVVRAPGTFVAQTAVELDWNSNPVWVYTLPASYGYIHHDLERLPNGNTLVLGARTITVPSISSLPIVDDFILEVDPLGRPVWAWETWRHFNDLGFDALARQLISEQGGDWAHTNTVESLPPNGHETTALTAGNLVVSQRYTNIVFIIHKQTGEVVWRLGPDNNLSHGQHHTHMISDPLVGAGNILMFDNGSGTGYPLRGRSPGYSRVIEVDPRTQQMVWEYHAGLSGMFRRYFWSDIQGNAQRLPNGNTMVCSGTKGRLFEVTRTGEIVWEHMTPLSAPVGTLIYTIYRAYRMPMSWMQP